MTAAVKTLRQVEIECPPLVARALPASLLKELQLENPPPIIFKKFQSDNLSGYCMASGYVEYGEIALHDFLSETNRTVPETVARRELVDVYLHEISHRLAPEGSGHNAVFATINLALLLRAEPCYPSLFHKLQLYNFHDHFLPGASVNAIAAFGFIVKNGELLAESNLTAEKIAIEATRLWTEYESELLSMPVRQAAQSAAALNMKESLHQAQKIKWQFLAAGFFVGVATVKFFG